MPAPLHAHGRPDTEQDPHSPRGVRPLGDRDGRQGDRRDRDPYGRVGLRSRSAPDREERLRGHPLAVQGQGLPGALRDPHAQAAHRHPPAHPEDRRLAAAAGPPAGRRRHRDPTRVVDDLPPTLAPADYGDPLRRIGVLGLARASSTGCALRPCPARRSPPPRARGPKGGHLVAAIIARKLGMTQVFTEEGIVERVTVLEAGPCPVTGIRTVERDGYEAVQLAFGAAKEKHLSKAELGHLRKADAPPMKHLAEFRDEAGELTVGDTVRADAFEPGQKVKVWGVSRGKGSRGTIKPHKFSRGPTSHGSHNVRAPGSVGASATPSRVFKGIRGPGQMGNKRVTQRGLTIVELIADRNLMLVRGSVPGPKGSTVEVRTDG